MTKTSPNWCVYDHAKKAFFANTRSAKQRPRLGRAASRI